jgi:hypothetical protein
VIGFTGIMNRPWCFLAALACALAGCASKPSVTDHARRGPFFVPTNYTAEARLPASIQRVVLLPVHGGEVTTPEAAEALDSVFAAALNRQMRFEVVILTRDECQRSYGAPDIASTDALPHDFVEEVGRKYAADAVLFVDLTAYQTYRPLAVGIRAKLASVSDRKLVWAFDQIFSATDPRVADSARRFYAAGEMGPTPYDMTVGALQSPARFTAYAADAAFKTLPAR